jgi:hypothetical protein
MKAGQERKTEKEDKKKKEGIEGRHGMDEKKKGRAFRFFVFLF